MSDLTRIAVMAAAMGMTAETPRWSQSPKPPKPNPKKAKHRAKVKAARKQRSKA